MDITETERKTVHGKPGMMMAAKKALLNIKKVKRMEEALSITEKEEKNLSAFTGITEWLK